MRPILALVALSLAIGCESPRNVCDLAHERLSVCPRGFDRDCPAGPPDSVDCSPCAGETACEAECIVSLSTSCFNDLTPDEKLLLEDCLLTCQKSHL